MSPKDAFPHRAGSTPYWFQITGLGERTPSKVQLWLADIDEALTICARERELIDAAIRRNRITRPTVLNEYVPRFTRVVERAIPEDGVSDVQPQGCCLEEDLPKRNWRVFKPLRTRHNLTAAENISEIAAGGTIVVVGEGTEAFSEFLRRCGLTVVKLRYQRSVLPRRWRRPSFTEWLCANGHDLAGLGAIVFVGHGAQHPERAALDDADAIPPLVDVALDGLGRIEIATVKQARVRPSSVDTWPKISVVTVSFNQADYLEASIRSVLDQNYFNLQYIVVDGGSTDGSVEIIERYRDRCDAVIIESDRGQSHALNKGFALATGDMLTWLCSDDLLEPGSLARVARAYRRHGTDVVVGGCARIGETPSQEYYHHHSRLPLGRTVRLMPLDILNFMGS